MTVLRAARLAWKRCIPLPVTALLCRPCKHHHMPLSHAHAYAIATLPPRRCRPHHTFKNMGAPGREELGPAVQCRIPVLPHTCSMHGVAQERWQPCAKHVRARHRIILQRRNGHTLTRKCITLGCRHVHLPPALIIRQVPCMHLPPSPQATGRHRTDTLLQPRI